MDVMEWPHRKRVFYTQFMSSYRRQQREYQQSARDLDAGDLNEQAQAAQAHAQSAGGGMGASAGAGAGAGAGGQMPSTANIPDGVDPSKVPTPEGVENPYASAEPDADIDGERITRRTPEESGDEQRPQVDMSTVHPAVRKHGNVVQVSGDGDETDDGGTDTGGDTET